MTLPFDEETLFLMTKHTSQDLNENLHNITHNTHIYKYRLFIFEIV